MYFSIFLFSLCFVLQLYMSDVMFPLHSKWILQLIKFCWLQFLCNNIGYFIKVLQPLLWLSLKHYNSQSFNMSTHSFYWHHNLCISCKMVFISIWLLSGQKVVVHKHEGHIQARIVYYLMNTHITPRTIYLTRVCGRPLEGWGCSVLTKTCTCLDGLIYLSHTGFKPSKCPALISCLI